MAPQPGPLKSINSIMPHPRGEIKLSATFVGEHVEAEVTLPKGVTGVFVWRDKTRKLRGGVQRVKL
jgi:hypothetical protein